MDMTGTLTELALVLVVKVVLLVLMVVLTRSARGKGNLRHGLHTARSPPSLRGYTLRRSNLHILIVVVVIELAFADLSFQSRIKPVFNMVISPTGQKSGDL